MIIARCLRSEWFGLALVGLMGIGLAASLHDDRASTPLEQSLALGAMALVVAWLAARGLSGWSTARHPSSRR